MKKLLYTFVLTIFVMMGCTKPSSTEIKVVSADEMQTILDMEDVQLVDVRTPTEYSEESIPGAQNIDFNSPTFEDDITNLDRTKPVILYCKKGGRSAKCATKLKEAGFIKVYDLDGGITKWKYKGYKVKRRS